MSFDKFQVSDFPSGPVRSNALVQVSRSAAGFAVPPILSIQKAILRACTKSDVFMVTLPQGKGVSSHGHSAAKGESP